MTFDCKDVVKFTQDYQNILRRIDTFEIILSNEARVYTFLDLVALWYNTWATIKNDSLKQITGISKKATADELLPSIDSLVSDLLDHDAQEKRKDKIHIAARGINNNNSQQFGQEQSRNNGGNKNTKKYGDNEKICSYCKKTNHDDSTCFFKHGFPESHRLHGKKPSSTKEMANKSKEPQTNLGMGFTVQRQPRVMNTTVKKGIWLLDSGAHYHCTNTLDGLIDRTPVQRWAQASQASRPT
jgi:hypothetical protein